MDDIIDLILMPILFIFKWIFRAIFFLVFSILHEYILWSVGWVFFRLITFGKYPKARMWNDEKAPVFTLVIVSLTGALIITLVVILLMVT